MGGGGGGYKCELYNYAELSHFAQFLAACVHLITVPVLGLCQIFRKNNRHCGK